MASDGMKVPEGGEGGGREVKGERSERGMDQKVWKREGKNARSIRTRRRTVLVREIAVLLLDVVDLVLGITYKFRFGGFSWLSFRRCGVDVGSLEIKRHLRKLQELVRRSSKLHCFA